jgi:hypothetical protein
MGDHMYQPGIGDHNPIHIGRQHFSHDRSIPRRLDRHMISWVSSFLANSSNLSRSI